MRLSSGKAFLEMASPNTNISSTSNTQNNPQIMQEQSTHMPFNGSNVSTAMGITASFDGYRGTLPSYLFRKRLL